MNIQLQFDRAGLVWDILVLNAKNKTLISYKDLGDLVEIHHRVVRYPLDLIQKYCIKNNLPPLSILVANRNGIRGQGFIQQGNLNILEKKVQIFNWGTIVNPFNGKLIIKKRLCSLGKIKDKDLIRTQMSVVKPM